jgi:phosphotriesterase-related protein
MRVRTVLGDVDPARLGVTYVHEHLIIDSPLVADRWPHIHLPSVDEATAEVARCIRAGVATMVDAMPAASGRNVVKLAEVSRRTGMRVVAATGLHTAKYYEAHRWTSEEPPEVLAELFVADVTEGIDSYDYLGPVVRRTRHQAGILKVAMLGPEPADRDRRLFAAAAIAHAATGVPILTHCEEGRGGDTQVGLLAELGVPLARVVMSHTDKVADPGYHRELLAAGVNLEYDQALREGQADGTRRLLEAMLAEGHGDQIMLGTDGARRSLWTELGGAPGLAWLYTGFGTMLDPAVRHRLFVDNPARFLAF